MISRRLLLILFTGSLIGWAADSAVQGPVTGFLFDAPARAVRPMVGIPGAAYLGRAVITNADSASVSPNGKIALTMQKGRLIVYSGLGTVPVTRLPIKGAIVADIVAWAPDSGSAAIYSLSSAQLQILSGLQQTPAVGTPIGLDTLSGRVAALAFDGQRVIIALAGGDLSGIYSLSAQSAPQRIASAVEPSAVALAAGDLYFTDNRSRQIWQVHNYASQPAASLFATSDSISSAVGLQLSADGTRLYVADAGSHLLNVYDVASRSVSESIALTCAPTRLERFGNAAVFVLNAPVRSSRSIQPLYVVADGPQKRSVYFVPAPDDAGLRRPISRPAEQP